MCSAGAPGRVDALAWRSPSGLLPHNQHQNHTRKPTQLEELFTQFGLVEALTLREKAHKPGEVRGHVGPLRRVARPAAPENTGILLRFYHACLRFLS
jgi:hypothetical protein